MSRASTLAKAIGASGNIAATSLTVANYVGVNGASPNSTYPVDASGTIRAFGDGKGFRFTNTANTNAGSITARTGTGTGIDFSTDAGPLYFSTSSVASSVLTGLQWKWLNNGTSAIMSGDVWGGAIRFSANSSSNTDRYLSLGWVNNSNAYTGVMTVSDGTSTTYPVTITAGDASTGATVWPQYIQMTSSGGSNSGNGAGTLYASYTNNGQKPVAAFASYLMDGGSTSTNYGGGAAIWVKNPGSSSMTRMFAFDQYGNIGGGAVALPAAANHGFYPGTYGSYTDNSAQSGQSSQMTSNLYHDGTNWIRRNNAYGVLFEQYAGDASSRWYTSATSGTGAVTLNNIATLSRSGDLSLNGGVFPKAEYDSSLNISGIAVNTWTTIISPGSLVNGGSYWVTFRWDHSSSGGPYIVAGAFMVQLVNTNGTGAGNTFTPMCSSHTGGGDTISWRTVAGSASSTGLQFKLDTFTGNGPLSVKCYRFG